MKSNKQRRLELDAKRQARAEKIQTERTWAAQEELESAATVGVVVDRLALAPHGSYDEPEFVIRGFYLDQPFQCIDCGKGEVWTAQKQKWWYETAKGDVFTTARRCRACRRIERERREEVRRVHLTGLALKRQGSDYPPTAPDCGA